MGYCQASAHNSQKAKRFHKNWNRLSLEEFIAYCLGIQYGEA
jgi:hypothetical protein